MCELIEREVINRCCVYDTNRSIIAEIKQTLNSEGLGGKISKKENLTRRSQRKRTSVKNEGVPIKTYADLHLLSEDYKNYQNRPFLVLNSAIKDKNILIFMASNGYEILNNSSTWALDGTHRKTPAPFSQIYIIGGMQNSRFLPACYCLVPNHESVTYTIILNFLKDFVKESPKRFLLDFEIAMFKSILEVFGKVFITGCQFHFVQNIEKNIKKKGLMKICTDNPLIKNAIKMIYVLTTHVLSSWLYPFCMG